MTARRSSLLGSSMPVSGADPHYQIELANKIAGGRAVGNSYIVTRRPDRLTCELARFDTREEAEAWIAERTPR